MPDEEYDWEPLRPHAVADLFIAFDAPWWVAGGWALDLFLGRETRVHDDIDVELPRAEQFRLQRLLSGWDCQEAHDGELRPWLPHVPLRAAVNSTWARRSPDHQWCMQLMFARVHDGIWHYRRQPAITRPLDTIIRTTNDGIPYLCPEIQLLFKANAPRPKDEHDFNLVLPLLDAPQRAWLHTALAIAGHSEQWRGRLV